VAGPAARILSPSPDATDGALRVTRREAWVIGFDCGAGAGPPVGVTPPARTLRPYLIERKDGLPVFHPRDRNGGTEGLEDDDADGT
jgi:hypothetical protein